MKSYLLILMIIVSGAFASNAQIADGSVAPDFTVTDINGGVHNLYDYLDAGKHVLLDFSATWCGPCWSYHNASVLKNLWNLHGPGGTNDIMVFHIEIDLNTNLNCLYGPSGCVGGTQGNWVAGTPYPIVNLTSTNEPNLDNEYQIIYVPTLFAVNAYDKRVFEVGTKSVSVWQSWFFNSFEMDYSATVVNGQCPQTSQISLNVTDGYQNKSYLWSNNATTATISNLPNGGYDCEITDGNGYFLNTDVFTVNAPQVIQIETLEISDIFCNGTNTGSIAVNATGGNGNFTYLWSNGNIGWYNGDLEAGAYSVTATDVFGCESYESFYLNEPPELIVNPVLINATCGQNNGSITLNTSGGVAPYTYELAGVIQSNPTFINLAGGNYDYVVSDFNSCILISNVTLAATSAPVAITSTIGNITCTIPTAQVSGAGSSSGPNINYLWTTNDGNIVSGANQLVATINEGGTYNLLVTNTTNGCSKSSSTIVSADNTAPSVIIQSPSSINCTTSEVSIDGSMSSTGSQYNYTWTTTDGNIVSGLNSLNPVVDKAGTYSLNILNTSNGCSEQGMAVILSDTIPPTISIPEATLTCEFVSVELCANSNGLNFLWNVSNDNAESCILVNEEGTYSVTVTGVNGCTSNSSSIVTSNIILPSATINAPDALTCLIQEVNINATVDGNTGEFLYQWTTNNGVITSGSNTLSPTVTAPGEYVLEVTNSITGCVSEEAVTVDEISEAPIADFSGLLAGSVLTVTPAIINTYNNYFWDFDNNMTSDEPIANHEFTETGTYNVCLTVSNDCGSNMVCYEYTFISPLIIIIEKEDVTCYDGNDGSVHSLTSGGLLPLNVIWHGPNGFTSNELILTGLISGQYNLTLTDASGIVINTSVEISQPEVIEANTVTIINDTNNQQQGGITFMAAGGILPYSYLWSNGQTSQHLTSVGPGDYSVLVTDAAGCVKTFGPFTVQNISSVREEKYLTLFNIYPSPASNFLNIEVNLVNKGKSEVKLKNSIGHQVLSQRYNGNISDRIDVSAFPSGIYFIELSGENFHFARKVMIIR
ncbi:MAG: PKD domain-containing protein [Saprospiraceae bacterium]|nr:PKD domain-containing protein [Saprospiraceae bacterium]